MPQTQHPETAPEPAAEASATVPFFARKAGRPALTVRSGVRAGAQEEQAKRRTL